jgi:sec-independent protein translocase protein TatB
MFGIGLPEMIVILAVALIVVGPDKLPELARSLARGVQELKKTVDEVKSSLQEESGVLDEVQTELKETAHDLNSQLLESDTWQPGENDEDEFAEDDLIDLEPLEERPWERDCKTVPDHSEQTEQADHPGQPDRDNQMHTVQDARGELKPESTDKPPWAGHELPQNANKATAPSPEDKQPPEPSRT